LADNATLRTYLAQGTCDATGSCRYEHRDIPCQHGCENSACKNDPCAGGCDDNNECTDDVCEATGCRHYSRDNSGCYAGGDCPIGRCIGSTCLPVTGETCEAEIQTSLCSSVDVPGVCTGSGECVPAEPGPGYTCDNCLNSDGTIAFCLWCEFFPGVGAELCLAY